MAFPPKPPQSTGTWTLIASWILSEQEMHRSRESYKPNQDTYIASDNWKSYPICVLPIPGTPPGRLKKMSFYQHYLPRTEQMKQYTTPQSGQGTYLTYFSDFPATYSSTKNVIEVGRRCGDSSGLLLLMEHVPCSLSACNKCTIFFACSII